MLLAVAIGSTLGHGALANAMTVDAAVTGACEVAESQTPVLGVAVPYAVGTLY